MSAPTTCYGWREGEAWFLSLFPREAGKAKNKYASKDEAIKDAKDKRLTIVWED